MLHRVDQLPVKCMAFTRPPIAEKAANRQKHIGHFESLLVHLGNTGRDARQTEARNAR